MNSLVNINQYKLITKDKVRYSDTDRQGHVNNAIFNQFLETGRVELLYEANNPLHLENCSFVIVKLSIEFLKEIHWPGEVVIGTKILKIGNSSFDIDQAIFQNNVLCARANTTIVQVDNDLKKAAALSEKTKEILNSYS